MQTLAYLWFDYRLAQQRVRDAFAQAPLPDEQSCLNSSAVAQADREFGGREVDPISRAATSQESACLSVETSNRIRRNFWLRAWSSSIDTKSSRLDPMSFRFRR
jgi:hypothetical protein